MPFGSGVLISAVSFELVEDLYDQGGLAATAVGFALGAVVYIAAKAARPGRVPSIASAVASSSRRSPKTAHVMAINGRATAWKTARRSRREDPACHDLQRRGPTRQSYLTQHVRSYADRRPRPTASAAWRRSAGGSTRGGACLSSRSDRDSSRIAWAASSSALAARCSAIGCW
jgi:hypothetical protein